MPYVAFANEELSMQFKIVESLREALQARELRNSCRLDLTNHRDHIGVLRQVRWYFTDYLAAKESSRYRVYVLYNERQSAVGYGALCLRNGELYITECVAPKYRRQGHGQLILQQLIQIAVSEQRDLVAEIWVKNIPSLALHRKAGFEIESSCGREGEELQRHRLCLRKR
jgi:ribosomal protein S18 acetylase RimI-like enzyme